MTTRDVSAQSMIIPMNIDNQMIVPLMAGLKRTLRIPIKQAYNDPATGELMLPDGLAQAIKAGQFDRAFARPGDRIWIRETFRFFDASQECGCSESPCPCPRSGTVLYRATDDYGASKWKPSTSMTRKHSRLTLQVTGVSIERISQMSDSQAVDEGMPTNDEAQAMAIRDGMSWYERSRAWYKRYWEHKYGTWFSNPYVWVIEFDVVHKNVDAF